MTTLDLVGVLIFRFFTQLVTLILYMAHHNHCLPRGLFESCTLLMVCRNHCFPHGLFQADVIMALAGSNGGSWSTTYSPKSAVKPVGESTPNGENETGTAGNSVFPREFRGRLSLSGNPSQVYGSGDRILTLTGNDPNLS